MADVAAVGIAVETDGVDKGIKKLSELAQQGPKVEKAMSEAANGSKQLAKSLADLSSSGGDGLKKTGEAAQQAASGIKASGAAAREAVSDTASLARAMANLTVEEEKHLRKLAEEANGLRMTRGEMEAYKAAQKGLGIGAQEVARAMGQKIEAMKAEQEAMARSSKAAGDLTGVTRLLGRGLAVLGLSVSVGEFIKMADASTNVASKLKLVTTSTAELKSVQDGLFQTAQRSRVSYVDLVTTYAQMARSTKELNVSQQDMLKVTQSISQAVTISGGSAQSTQAALIQLSQGFASGTLRGEELNSVMEQTPRLAMAIAQGMGVTVGELRKLGSEGKLTAEMVFEALKKSAGSVQADFSQMTVTVEQATTNVTNSLTRMVGAIDSALGATSALAGGMQYLSKTMDEASGEIDRLSKAKNLSDFFLLVSDTTTTMNGKISDAKGELARLETQLSRNPNNLFLQGAINKTRALIEELASAKAHMNALEGGAASADPTGRTGTRTRSESYSAYADAQRKSEQALSEVRAKAAGINKDYFEQLKVYQDALKNGVIGIDSYKKEVSDLAKRTWDASTAGKEEAKAKRESASASKSAEAAVRKEQSEYDKLVSSIKLKILANDEELKYGRKLSDADKLRFLLSEDGTKKLTAAHKANAQAQLAELDRGDRLLKQKQAEIDIINDRIAIQDELTRAEAERLKSIGNLDLAIMRLRMQTDQETERLKLEASLIGASNIERKIAISLYDLEIERKKKLQEIDENPGLDEGGRALRKQWTNEEYARKAANASGQAYLEEWKSTVDQVENWFTDSFTRMLTDGKGGWDAMCKSLKASFLTLVVKQIYAAFVKPIVVNLVGNLMGFTGGGGFLSSLGGLFGGDSSSGGGPLGQVGSLFSNGSTAYNMYTGQGLPGQAYNYVANMFGFGGNTTAAAVGEYGAFEASGVAASDITAGAGSNWFSNINPGTAALIIPLVAAYLGGMFKDEVQVGQGLTGDLGGDMYGYQLMRESGGLFDGPDYRYVIAEKEINETKAKIEALKANNPYAAYGERGDARRDDELQRLYNKLDVLEREYGTSIDGSKGPIKILQDAFSSMRESTASQADILGLDGDSIRKMTVALGMDTIHPDTGGKGLELTGLTQEEASAKIQQALGQANEELARSVLGTWEEQTKEVSRMVWENVLVNDGGDTERYQRIGKEVTETITENVWVMSEYVREGETAVQALGRLSSSLMSVNQVFDLLGVNLYDTSLAGADLASGLIDVFGGADKFVGATSNYYDKFYSDQEKVSNQTRLLNAELTKLGIDSMPASREALRDYIEGIDLSTEEGQKLYASLLGLVDVFDMIYTSAENIASLKEDLNVQLLRAQGNDAEATRLEREKQIKELEKYNDPELVRMQREVWAAEDKKKVDDEAKQAAESAKALGLSNLQAAIDREKEYWNTFTNDAKDALTKASSYFDLVTGAAASLRGSIDDVSSWNAAQGMVFIEQAVANARMGLGLSDYDKTKDAIGAATGGLVMDNYATQADLDYDKKVLAGQLDELGGFAELAKSDAQKQIDLATDQIKRLDDTLKFWQDYGKEQVSATMSVTDAVNALYKLLDPKEQERIKQEEAAKAGLGGGGSTGGYVPTGGGTLGGTVAGSSKYPTVIGFDAQGRAIYSDGSKGSKPGEYDASGVSKNAALSEEQWARLQAGGSPYFGDGTYYFDEQKQAWLKRNSFAVGTNYVPYDMTANIHQGERIIPAADNRALMAAVNGQGGGGSSELVNAINKLEARLAEIENNTADSADSGRKTADTLSQVTEGGNAMRTLDMA